MALGNKPKVLILDIEWRPALAYVWRMWDENIQPDMLVDHGGMLCFCAHWEGSREFMFFSEWEDGRVGMAQAAKDLLEEADAVVTYNGDKYDLPKIRGEIVLAGLLPPAPTPSIDVMKTVKQFGFNMNRLAYIGPLLGVGGKVKHEGFNLWKAVMDGNPKAQAKMERYCTQDVRLLARLYKKIRPFIKNHPYLQENGGPDRCPACGSKHAQKRGFIKGRYYKTQRNRCNDCGHWFKTTRQRIK